MLFELRPFDPVRGGFRHSPGAREVRPDGTALQDAAGPTPPAPPYEQFRLSHVELRIDRPPVPGLQWPDFLHVGDTADTLVVTERVVRALVRAGIRGFRQVPVRPMVMAIGAAGGIPNYVALLVQPGVKGEQLPWSPRRGQRATRIRPASWTGIDLFAVQNFPRRSHWYCTRRVVELAREHFWTNARFVPHDADWRHAEGWNGREPWGVDYLCEVWPPEWYPPRIAGSLDARAWFERLVSAEPGSEDAARSLAALADLGDEALLLARSVLEEERGDVRRAMAFAVVRALHAESHPVSKALLDAAEREAAAGALRPVVRLPDRARSPVAAV